MKDQTEQKMEAVLAIMEKIEDAQAHMDGLKIELHDAAWDLKEYDPEFVSGLTKTPYKNKFYSIRSRYNKDLKQRIAFVCAADRAFGSWLKGKKKAADVEEDSVESPFIEADEPSESQEMTEE